MYGYPFLHAFIGLPKSTISLPIDLYGPLSPTISFERLELTHYRRRRFFLLHVPKRHSSIDKWSLLIFLHGGTRTARKDAVVTGFSRVGQREGFPRGLENHWNEGRNLSTTASEQKVDDVWSM